MRPSRVRYGVLAFACVLSLITYLDRVCISRVAGDMAGELGLDLSLDSDRAQWQWVFTAFIVAYAVFEIPGGWLGDVYGPRVVLTRIVLWWSFFTCMTGACTSLVGLVFVRFLFGMGEAGAYPNIARVLGSWFPPGRRGFAQGMVLMCGRLGGAMAPLIITGTILGVNAVRPHVEFLEGVSSWRLAFYVFGSAGIVWCLFFYPWYRDNPEQKSGVNAAELAEIRGPVAPTIDSAGRRTPWGRIFGSRGVWCLFLMYACVGFSWYFYITWLPEYLKQRFAMQPADFGRVASWLPLPVFDLLCGLPLLCGAISCLAGGWITDGMVRRTGNKRFARAFLGVGGGLACGVCLAAIPLLDNPWAVAAAFSAAALFNDLAMASAWAVCVDIGGRYSGTVGGMMNMGGNFGGTLGSLAIPLLTAGNSGDPTRWNLMFFVFGGVCVFGAVLWMMIDATAVVDDDRSAASSA